MNNEAYTRKFEMTVTAFGCCATLFEILVDKLAPPHDDGFAVGGHDGKVIINDLPKIDVLVEQNAFPESFWEAESLPSSQETPEGPSDVAEVHILEQFYFLCISEEISVIPW